MYTGDFNFGLLVLKWLDSGDSRFDGCRAEDLVRALQLEAHGCPALIVAGGPGGDIQFGRPDLASGANSSKDLFVEQIIERARELHNPKKGPAVRDGRRG
jgi:hypothetical protein